jgi:hypothetical protein
MASGGAVLREEGATAGGNLKLDSPVRTIVEKLAGVEGVGGTTLVSVDGATTRSIGACSISDCISIRPVGGRSGVSNL